MRPCDDLCRVKRDTVGSVGLTALLHVAANGCDPLGSACRLLLFQLCHFLVRQAMRTLCLSAGMLCLTFGIAFCDLLLFFLDRLDKRQIGIVIIDGIFCVHIRLTRSDQCRGEIEQKHEAGQNHADQNAGRAEQETDQKAELSAFGFAYARDIAFRDHDRIRFIVGGEVIPHGIQRCCIALLAQPHTADPVHPVRGGIQHQIAGGNFVAFFRDDQRAGFQQRACIVDLDCSHRIGIIVAKTVFSDFRRLLITEHQIDRNGRSCKQQHTDHKENAEAGHSVPPFLRIS